MGLTGPFGGSGGISALFGFNGLKVSRARLTTIARDFHDQPWSPFLEGSQVIRRYVDRSGEKKTDGSI